MIGRKSVDSTRSGFRGETSLVRKLVVVALVIPAVLALHGCAGVVTAKNTSGQTTESFQLSPASVAFGKVTVGKQSTQTVTVSNTGNASLSITSAQVSNAQFSVSGMAMPLGLAPGQSANFTVGVTATAAGNLAGTLTVSGDSGSTPVVVNLSATAVSASNTGGPQLSVSPTSVDFGSVSTGTKGTTNVVLSNTGTSNLTVSVLTLTGAEFSISGITTPATIAAGQSANVAVTFSPTTAGSATGSLSITSNDTANPTVSIPLSGTGSAAASGRLSASPASLAFGTQSVGSSANQQVVVTNTGNAAVKISSVTASGTGYSVTGLVAQATLNPSASATLTATYAPAAAGNASGSITIVSDASNSSLTIPLSGTGAQAGLSVSPSTFNFGSVVDGQTKSQSFTVTNTGTASLTVGQISVNGAPYSVSGLNTPATIAAGASTTFSVLFAPTTAGSLAGSVSISSNAPNSPNAVVLAGTGVAAAVTLSANPASVSFANVNAGTSTSKSVTVTNSGNTSVTLSQVSVNAKDFSVSGMSTPVTLNAGQSAAMTVNFQPTAAENISGNITVSSSSGNSAVIPVNGVGVQPALTVTPASASFGDVTMGAPSTQTVQITNNGTGTLTISQVSASGSGFSTGSLSLPISLAASRSTSFNIVFSPASAGAVSGAVTIVSNAPSSPTSIALTGTGVAASQTLSFSSTSLAFGNVNSGASSTQTVTVTNSGNSNVTISSITESGAGFTLSGAGAPVTLSAGQRLSFGVVFSPTAAGGDTGSVTVTSNATGSPTTISLSGTGVAVTPHTVALSWTASTSTVNGYNVYRSTTSGSGYAKINSALVSGISYTDSSTLQSGTTYYYVTTAVDSSGNESSYSNSASAAIP
ncbi:MAG TPA: choice-of-anchor D domain-containing protein [Dongiaceae bacterium]|nr:choice-of-anchor D domain-containing protein [Dongiaceae bacterium]